MTPASSAANAWTKETAQFTTANFARTNIAFIASLRILRRIWCWICRFRANPMLWSRRWIWFSHLMSWHWVNHSKLNFPEMKTKVWCTKTSLFKILESTTRNLWNSCLGLWITRFLRKILIGLKTMGKCQSLTTSLTQTNNQRFMIPTGSNWN